MATNIKHISSKKYNKALTLQDRNNLSNIITTNRGNDGSLTIRLNSIAQILEKDPTTISKEVKMRRSSFKITIPNYVYTNRYCKCCAISKSCKLKDSIVSNDKGRCDNFQQNFCKYTLKFPYVCNGCPKRALCTYPKTYYYPLVAQEQYRTILSDSREGSTLTLSEFQPINETITSGLKLGQSVEHIIRANNLPISTKTAYNYLRRGYFEANLLDTRRMMRFKTKERIKPRNSKILREKKIGHQYEDFLDFFANHKDRLLSQWDTVEGTKGGKVIFSIMLPMLHFQFFFLLPNKTAKAVVDKLNEIEEKIGIEVFKTIFGFALTDNGSEFTDIDGMVFSKHTGELRTNLFFCHPMRSDEKGSCERNHEILRYILPKGKSFDNLTQSDLDTITSHINSYKRKSAGFLSPIEKFCALYGDEILDKLNISFIDPKNVKLTRFN